MGTIIFLLILFSIDIYFYMGTSSIAYKIFGNKLMYKIIYWMICIVVYIGIIYVIFNYNKTTPTLRYNNNIIYSSLFFILFVSKFFGSLILMFDDILRFCKITFNLTGLSEHTYDLGRLKFLKQTALLFSGALFSTLLIGMKWGRYKFKKNYQNIVIKNWPAALNNYKIVQISDLHLGSFNSIEKLEYAVKIINNEEPDLVVFTGDLVNNYYHEALPFIDTLQKIKAKDGKFSILGNHDYCDYVRLKRESKKWKENFKNLLGIQKKAGFDLLLNESRVVNIKNNKFNIVGVENWGAGNFNKDGDLDKAMNIVNQELPTILLSHDPSHWRSIVLKSNYKISLQLSGHTHGMQFGIDIPGLKWSPVQYRYKEWGGLYKEGEKQIYVNRGLGHLGYAGRVGIMPDISILNIKSQI